LSFAAQLLFSYGMGFTSASRGSVMTQLTPVVTWVLSIALLDAWPDLVTFAGALLCLGGGLVTLITRHGPTPAL